MYRILFNGLFYNRRPTNDTPRLLSKNQDYEFTRFKSRHSAHSDIISNISSCFEYCQNNDIFDDTTVEVLSEDGSKKDITDFVIKRAYRNMLVSEHKPELRGNILKPFLTKMVFQKVEYKAIVYSELKEHIVSALQRKTILEMIKGLVDDDSTVEVWSSKFACGLFSIEEASFLKLGIPEEFRTKIIILPSIEEIETNIKMLKFPGRI